MWYRCCLCSLETQINSTVAFCELYFIIPWEQFCEGTGCHFKMLHIRLKCGFTCEKSHPMYCTAALIPSHSCFIKWYCSIQLLYHHHQLWLLFQAMPRLLIIAVQSAYLSAHSCDLGNEWPLEWPWAFKQHKYKEPPCCILSLLEEKLYLLGRRSQVNSTNKGTCKRTKCTDESSALKSENQLYRATHCVLFLHTRECLCGWSFLWR